MTTLAIAGYQPFTRAVNTASGPESRNLQQLLEVALCHFRDIAERQPAFSDLARLFSDTRQAGWDEYDARPINVETYRIAIRFLSALPTTLPSPDVGLDPDGEINFQWMQERGRVFTISANANGRLSYAGIFGEGQTSHGTEVFDDTIPSAIIQLVKRATESS
jgi:hypothetical protein